MCGMRLIVKAAIYEPCSVTLSRMLVICYNVPAAFTEGAACAGGACMHGPLPPAGPECYLACRPLTWLLLLLQRRLLAVRGLRDPICQRGCKRCSS